MEKLARAGFGGDFLCLADPYVQGPVPRMDSLEAFVRLRAAYLEAEHSACDVFGELYAAYAALERAREYESVNIWMEHDSHDQLILAKLLHFFCDPAMRPPRLRYISVTGFPGVKRFIGLGQLPADALRTLWNDFAPVDEPQRDLGSEAWNAITQPEPSRLVKLIASGTPALPTMARALARHLRELPSLHNGLSLTEQITLEILAREGAMAAGRLFGSYTSVEPLPFMGDSGYWAVLRGLANVEQPALGLEYEAATTRQAVPARVTLLPFGDRLLRDGADWLRANAIERWVGGMRIDSREQLNWRCDGANRAVLA